MTSLRSLRLFLVIAFAVFSGGGANAQNPAIDCKAQNPSPGCTAVQTQAQSSDLPKVTYLNGQLTITARNARLGDILRAVSTQTGAVIEFPSDRAGERVFAQDGPRPVRDVLAALLSGSRFNYVMLGSPSNPNVLQRVILTNSDQPARATPPETANQTAPPVVTVQAASAPAESETSDNGVLAVLPAAPLEVANPEHIEPPKQPLSPEVLKQLVQERMAARRQQQQQQPDPPQ